MKFCIETSRLILQDMLPEHANGLFAMDSDPLVHTYLGNNPVNDIQHVYDYIDNIQKQYQRNGIGRWTVIEKQSGDVIGWGGLKFIDDRTYNNRTHFYDIGYRLGSKFWGKGYATEIAAASRDHAFNTIKVKTLIGLANIDNLASRAVLLKTGLKFKEYFEDRGMTIGWYEMEKQK